MLSRNHQHFIGFIWKLLMLASLTHAYHRDPCTRHAATEFSLPDCYLPSMNDDLLLSQASFVFAHDAATGYIHIGVSKTGLSSFYSKTQVGTLYEQLNNGARALDLRPFLLSNGTAIFHHGAIRVPVSFETAIQEVVRWANDNPSELVLLFTSHFDYENGDNQYYENPTAMTDTLSGVYSSLGVAYVTCDAVYEWTVGEAMEASVLSTGGDGHVLALDGQDYYGSFCGKDNWIESEAVTCWPPNNRTSCKKSKEQWEKLQTYILASANNDATDDSSQLGPPASLDLYPFNEIQGIWQVDAHAIAMGLTHFSSILEDNHASGLNADMVDLIYDGAFSSISLLAVDNVALHGNALLSVLRHTCGQSTMKRCGKEIPIPPMRRWRIRTTDVLSALLLGYTVALVGIFLYRRPRLVSTLWANLRGHGNSKADSRQENLLS